MPASIRITKVRNVKTPSRANATDAGCDLFIPTGITVKEFITKGVNAKLNQFANRCSLTGEYVNSHEDLITTIVLEPGERVLIPSGVHVQFPPGFALIAANKSGVAAKKGLVVGSSVVDADYQGEVHISLINTSTETVSIEAGEKIVQFILFPIECAAIVEIATLDELYPAKTDRAAGGFGSSGTK